MGEIRSEGPLFYSVQQVARKLGRSPETIRRWIRARILPAKRHIVTKHVVISAEAVRDLVERGHVDWTPGERPFPVNESQLKPEPSVAAESSGDVDDMPNEEGEGTEIGSEQKSTVPVKRLAPRRVPAPKPAPAPKEESDDVLADGAQDKADPDDPMNW